MDLEKHSKQKRIYAEAMLVSSEHPCELLEEICQASENPARETKKFHHRTEPQESN